MLCRGIFLAHIDQSHELTKIEQGINHLQSSCHRRFRLLWLDRFYSASIFESKLKPKGWQVTHFAKLDFLTNHI